MISAERKSQIIYRTKLVGSSVERIAQTNWVAARVEQNGQKGNRLRLVGRNSETCGGLKAVGGGGTYEPPPFLATRLSDTPFSSKSLAEDSQTQRFLSVYSYTHGMRDGARVRWSASAMLFISLVLSSKLRTPYTWLRLFSISQRYSDIFVTSLSVDITINLLSTQF